MKLSEPKRDDYPAEAAQSPMRVRATPILNMSLAWLLAVAGGSAQESQPNAHQLKAAFLLNFAKFVEWPQAAFAETNSPIVLGVLGENPFGDTLERTVRDKTVNNRPVVVKVFHSSEEATNCHLLFICLSEKMRLPEILKGLSEAKASVLTVGEMDRFTESGGMINFFLQGNKYRFQINEVAAKGAGLKISSKLLSLAAR
jgi:hypothetical protein